MSIFLRLLTDRDKATSLSVVVTALRGGEKDPRIFDVSPDTFSVVPGAPFAYWIKESVRNVFSRRLSILESDGRDVQSGATSGDDFRFLRLRWEPCPSKLASSRDETASEGVWVTIPKGGSFSSFFSEWPLVVNWKNDGVEIKEFVSEYRGRKGWGYNWTAALNGHSQYFRPGITWPRRTTSVLSMRVMPAGCIFADKGPAIFSDGDTTSILLWILGLVSSKAFAMLVDVRLAAADAAARSYEVGIIETTPVPSISIEKREQLGRLARSAWSLKRKRQSTDETSHAFLLPPSLQSLFANGEPSVIEAELADIQGKIDQVAFELYGFSDTDRADIPAAVCQMPQDITEIEVDDEEREDAAALTADAESALHSWAIGVAFGRFDVRLATGTRRIPPDPEPFDRLPACSPGMITGEDGLPLGRAPFEYPLNFPENGVLVDDPGHPLDLLSAIRAVFDVVFGVDADIWWNNVAVALDPIHHEPRGWLAGSFFEYHIKQYSKSRRKAPIFWQLSTPSARYSVWLYAHRLSRDSFFQLQNDVVGPKLIHEERQLADLAQNAGERPSPSQREQIANQETVVEELRAMLDEVKRIAPLWNPNLDDGTVLTMAPLWRLLPQHKTWQKELKKRWDELVSGQYDWAHVAMHLWPERVVPKCAIDRSLAIAHELGDIFWREGSDGKWEPRPKPTRPIEELVRERGSTAVKSALRSLLEAPVAKANGVPRRGRRASHVASDKGAS